MKIAYKFYPELVIDESVDLNRIDEADLRYNWFTGDVHFINDTIELVFDGITIYDFIINFRNTLNELKEGDSSEFDFTESDSLVLFKKRGERIEIFSQLTNKRIKPSFSALKTEGKEFIKSFCRDLIHFYPNDDTYRFIKLKFDLEL